MNRSRIILILVVCGVAAAAIFFWRPRPAAGGNIARRDLAPAPESPAKAVPTPPAAAADSRPPLEKLFTGLEKLGAKRFDSPQAVVADALKRKDRKEIAQAINQIVYDSPWPRASVLATLRSLLENGDIETRLDAARSLYVMGDESGRDALLAVVRTPDAIMVSSPAFAAEKQDLRLAAAEILAGFRDGAAKSALLELYDRTKARPLLRYLVELGAEEAGPRLKEATHNKPSYELMEAYGLLDYRAELGGIIALKNDEKTELSTRLAAAWALARMEKDNAAGELIRDYVSTQMDEAEADRATLRRAVKYLGSLADPASIEVLTRVTQQSSKPGLVQIAAVNLILNHPAQAAPAQELVLAELNGAQTKLGRELAINLAALSGDRRLQEAGEAYDRRHPEEKTWKRRGADRSLWSPWGWAGDYVITLAKPPAQTN